MHVEYLSKNRVISTALDAGREITAVQQKSPRSEIPLGVLCGIHLRPYPVTC